MAAGNNAIAEQDRIKKRFPDYDRWTAKDIHQLDEIDFRFIVGSAARNQNYDDMIPASYIHEYGLDGGRAELLRDVLREAAHRGTPAIMAKGALRGIFQQKANLPGDKLFPLSVPVSLTLANGQVIQTLTDVAYNHNISEDIQNGKTETVIPRQVERAIVNASNGLLPAELADTGYGIEINDATAYEVGYAERAKLGTFGPTNPPTYNEAVARKALPAATRDIFDPHKPGAPLKDAYAAGFIQSDLDAKQGYANTGDYLFGPPAPTPPGRNGAARSTAAMNGNPG